MSRVHALKRKSVFLFDFDGTLVQSNAIKREAFFEAVADCPDAADPLAEILDTPGAGDRFAIFQTLADRVPAIDAVARTDAYGAICERRILAAPEVEGAQKLLERLRARGAVAAINSATPQAPLQAVVAKMAISGYFAAVFGGPASKADNARRFLSGRDVPPANIVVIGDGDSDRVCADELGCDFIAIESNGNDFRQAPAHRAANLTVLFDWLDA